MAGVELLSDQGYRVDGRRASELRRVQCRLGVLGHADGSALLQLGNTRALAVVSGPHEIRGSKSKALHDRAVVNCQYSMATFSMAERKRRPHGDRKSIEMSLHLRQTFETAILTQLFPRSQIDIFVQILQSDGGNYCVCVNAATMALVDAGIPLQDYVCACSVGFVDETPLVDVSYAEEAAGGPVMAVALLPRSEQVAFLSLDSRLHEDHLSGVMKAATVACRDLHAVLSRIVKETLQEATAGE